MALAPARQAGGRAARIADFWRISAVFWLHTGIRIFWGADHGSRISVHGSRPAGHRIVARCRRDLTAGCRLPVVGSRPASHGRCLRAGMFGTKSAGRGSAALTLLMAQCWPVAGIKKPPLVMHQRGRLLACAGLKRLL